MSIAEQIERINKEKKRIATKTTQFGLTDNDTADLKTLADAISGITYHECVNVTITQDGDPFEIIPGYHKGGFIYAVDNPDADKPKYLLEPGRVVTPLKNTDQIIEKGAGYYGLGTVTVKAIPHPYHDVSGVDATKYDVLANKKFVNADGTLDTGRMINNGTVTKVLDATRNSSGELTNASYDIPVGYHDGDGTVSVSYVTPQPITPTKQVTTIVPIDGSFMDKVIVEPIPDNYIDKTDENVAKTEADLSSSGATVTVPAGYYAQDATKTVKTVDRANTTLTSTKNDNGKKFELVASNNQPEGYTDGGEKTATKTVTLTMIGGKAVMSDGTSLIEVSAQAATRAETNLTVSKSVDDSSTIYLRASNKQGTGYIYTESDKTASKTLKMSASGKTVSVTDENGSTVYGSKDVSSTEKVSGSINGMTTTTFTQTVDKFVGSIEVTLTDHIENALAAI